MLIIGIFVSLIVFSIIVILHELWHFSAARFFWVKVDEFWLGIPPKAKKIFTDKKWTDYTLNWLPLWGFVKLVWEAPNTFYVYDENKKLYNNLDFEKDLTQDKSVFYKDGTEIWELQKQQILKALIDNQAPYNLANKPSWQQAIIILAGVFVNFLLAWIIFSVLFFIGISPIWINTKLETDLPVKLIPNYSQALESGILKQNPGVILQPVEWSFAEEIWLKKWDIVYEIYTCDFWMNERWFCLDNNGNQLNESRYIIHKINSFWDLTQILEKFKWEVIQIYTNANIVDKDLQKQLPNSKIWDYLWWTVHGWTIPEDGKIWAYISENIEYNRNFEYKYWVLESIKYWFSETYYQSLLTFQWIGTLVKKIVTPETPVERQEAIAQVSGPIWIVDFITDSLSSWIKFMFIITAIISINLWVFNLLPIPALDGWRFIFITINGFIKKLFWRKAIHAGLENIVHVSFFILLIALSILIAYNDIIKIINS